MDSDGLVAARRAVFEDSKKNAQTKKEKEAIAKAVEEIAQQWSAVTNQPMCKYTQILRWSTPITTRVQAETEIYALVFDMVINHCLPVFDKGNAVVGTKANLFPDSMPKALAAKFYIYVIDHLNKAKNGFGLRRTLGEVGVAVDCEEWLANCCELSLVACEDELKYNISLVCTEDYQIRVKKRLETTRLLLLKKEFYETRAKIAQLQMRNHLLMQEIGPLESVSDHTLTGVKRERDDVKPEDDDDDDSCSQKTKRQRHE